MRAPLDMAKSTWPSPPVRMVALDWIFSPFCRGRGLSPSFSTMSGFPAKSATIVNPGFATELASVDWPINEMKVRNTKIKKTTRKESKRRESKRRENDENKNKTLGV